MYYLVLADIVVLIHLAFIVFALLGAVLAIRWPVVLWIHLPMAIWGALVEFSGWICPLTPLENWLRLQGGASKYPGDFLAHYILPILYPVGLTRKVQIILGAVVVVVNLSIYGYIFYRYRQMRRNRQPGM